MTHARNVAARRAATRAAAAALLAACVRPAAAQAPGTAPSTAPGAASADALQAGFRTPPNAAMPRVWWHWMNGNVTKAGITADLEWMHRVGIGGTQMFDGSLGTPQFVDDRLVWMTPGWKDAFRHAAAEADRLGLEMTMAASGGWSETGGPWVRPEQAMKKVVWSETVVTGGRRLTIALPKPPSNNGPFQTVGMPPAFDIPENTSLPGAKPRAATPPPAPDPTLYADTKVLAYRLPDTEVRMADRRPRVTSSASDVDLTAVTDGDLRTAARVPYAEGGTPTWIQIEFAEPFRAQAFTFAAPPAVQFFGSTIPVGEVQASQDGARWTTLAPLSDREDATAGAFVARTVAFPATAARYFRVVVSPRPADPALAAFGLGAAKQFGVTELELHAAPRVHRWQEKAAFGTMLDVDSAATRPVPNGEVVAPGAVVDLTARMRSDGALDWRAPAGRWAVLRLGTALTGRKNHPASVEATGYEVDKLSRAHVTAYAKTYADMVAGALGPAFGTGFRYFLMDSWEAGLANWTDDMLAQFRARRGYDATPYLPALTGRVVGSADASDRFLWDYRRTIADLLAENHYAAFAQYTRTRGVGLYAEAMGTGIPTTGDGLQNKGRVDVPMGEFWTPAPGGEDLTYRFSDMREAASAAHTYGRPVATAEAFTTCNAASVWSPPSYLKRYGDRAMALGINRFVVHTSDHQPFTDSTHKPGITLGPCGINYTRNNTWAEQSRAFNAYLARSSFLLQQGLPVVDAAYFYGEGAPATVPFWKPVRPAPPAGYSYDWVNAEVLLTRAAVRDGRVVLPSGMRYRVLVLPEDVDRLTLPVLRKLRDLVAAGATVVAPRPKAPPSLTGGAAADAEARRIADAVWGGVDGQGVTEHAYGRGRVSWGRPVGAVLAAQQTPPDVQFASADGAPADSALTDGALLWTHRRTAAADLYFVSNQREQPADVAASFRVDGKEAELWHPETGETEPAAYRIAGARTTVPLRLEPHGSVFVVFRRPASAPSRDVPNVERRTLTTLGGPWTVTFQPDRGAPPAVRFDSLTSWTAHADSGVRYYSGAATYVRELDAPAAWFTPGARIVLDLGQVNEIAEVTVNGQAVGGVLWKPPYTADVTGALRPGLNRVEVRVTNLWVNRIVGDLQPGVAKRYAFVGYQQLNKNTPLRESGLLGPVRLEAVTGGQAARVGGGQEWGRAGSRRSVDR